MKVVIQNIILFSAALSALIFVSCEERVGIDANPPIVMTAPLFDIADRSVQTGGEVLSTGDAYTTRGVVWSTEPSPTVDLSTKTSDGLGAGPFGSIIKKLQPSTTYFVRAYATNFKGTTYGEEFSFKTLSLPPELETHAVSQVGATSAVSGGNVPDIRPVVVISRGVVWSTSSDLGIEMETKTNEGGGIGQFTSTLTGLSPQTTYYVRAYAVKAWDSYGEGTVAYGPVHMFMTKQ